MANSKVKNKLKQGNSTISIAEEENIDLEIIELEQQEYIKEVKKQALAQRISLRQSIRDTFPRSLTKAIDIMDMNLEDLQASGKDMDFKENLSLLKIQLDAAKVIIGLASHVLGEDILTLWAEKEQVKKTDKKVVYHSEILQDGSVKLTAKDENDLVKQAGVDKLEITIDDIV